jgi:hypothetical protein
MNISLAETYVLRKWYLGHQPSFSLKLKELGYDFDKDPIYNDINSLSLEEKAKFIWDIEKYIDDLDLELDKKLYMMLVIVFTTLCNTINIKEEPVYSRVMELANRLIKEYSEPWFMVEIIERHGDIKVSHLLK